MPSRPSSTNRSSGASPYSTSSDRDPSVAASGAGPSLRPALIPSSGHPLQSMRETLGGRASAERSSRIEATVASVGGQSQNAESEAASPTHSMGSGGGGLIPLGAGAGRAQRQGSSGRGDSARARGVRWRDQTLVSRVVSTVTGRNMLVSGSVAVPSREEEPRQVRHVELDTVLERQDRDLRALAGMSLGRQTYLGLAPDDDDVDGAGDAVMLAHVPPLERLQPWIPALASLAAAEPGSILARAAAQEGGLAGHLYEHTDEDFSDCDSTSDSHERMFNEGR